MITGTLAQINALLASDGTSTISYIDNTDTPGASATLTLTVKDGLNATGSATSTITLVKVNDAPTVTVPVSAYSVAENGSLILKNTGLSVGDVDGGTGIETVTLSVSEGFLLATAGNGETVSGSGTSTITITGTLTQINALLGGGAGTLSYIDTTDRPTNAVLTLSITDNGNIGGGALTASATKAITVTPANDVPAGQAAAFSVSANPTGSNATLTVPAAFGLLVNDRDPDGDALTIATINDNAFTVGTPIALSLGTLTMTDLNGGFTFTPTAGGASGIQTFTYTASDGSGQSSAVTVTLNVIANATGTASPAAGQSTCAYIGTGSLLVRALIASARSSRACARCTIGISIILPSIANEPRPSAAACPSRVMMRSASVTSCADGLKPALRIGTSDGWMQADPTNPKSADRRTMRAYPSRSAKSATDPIVPSGRMPAARAA